MSAGPDQNDPPGGFIGLRFATAVTRSRMFADQVPAWVLKAAQANFKYVTSPTPENFPKYPKNLGYPKPEEVIGNAVDSDALPLYVWTDVGCKIFEISHSSAVEALRRTGFLGPKTRSTVLLSGMSMYPRHILDGLSVPALPGLEWNRFALCFREKEFDAWLSETARRNKWPLDAKGRNRRGRPERTSLAKPLVRTFIEGDRWHVEMPFKELVFLVNSRLGNQQVDRETVKKALNQLYEDTRELRYRYRIRQRVPRWTRVPK